MAKINIIKLPLTAEERYKLKQAKLKINKISELTTIELYNMTAIEKSRCKLLVALNQFQCLGSVGPKMAIKLYNLGFTNLDELKQADPIAMVKNYEQQVGKVVDPYVEDVFRCAIAQSKYQNLPPEAKQWWYWSKQRG